MEEYRSGKFATYSSKEFNFHETEESNIYELIDRNYSFDKLKPLGFKKYDDKISYLTIEKPLIKNAFRVTCFCHYNGGKYYISNVWEGFVILFPADSETKRKLGLHIYDDKSIDVPYEKFMDEAEEIWEERTPIEGFKFDVEPIHYLKKDGKYLE